jgi:hypothetical protein
MAGAMSPGSTELATDRLSRLLRDAASGEPPPADLEIETIRRVTGAVVAVVAFTGHVVVAADVGPGWVAGRCPPGDLVGPFRPQFLAELAERCSCTEFSPTVTLALPPGADPGREVVVVPADHRRSERVIRSRRVRTDVHVYESEDGRGLLLLGRGLAGRWEAGFEVEPEFRGHGLGRGLAAAARRLVPEGEPLFMQVVPGNIVSLRTVLGAGFQPVTSEALMW